MADTPTHYRHQLFISALNPTSPLCWRDEHGRHSRSCSRFPFSSSLFDSEDWRRAVGGEAGEQWRERASAISHSSLFLIVSWNLDQRSSGANRAIQWSLYSPVWLSVCLCASAFLCLFPVAKLNLRFSLSNCQASTLSAICLLLLDTALRKEVPETDSMIAGSTAERCRLDSSITKNIK